MTMPAAAQQLRRGLGGEFRRALDCVGGTLPVPKEEFALRAYLHALDPLRNPMKEVLDAYESVRATPPMLGIFSDIPWHSLRESDVLAWAKAGFTWVVCDGEHSQNEGRHGREQMAMFLRLGITPVQRLHREARSEHGDALTMGARATMHPYATTVRDVSDYLATVAYPVVGSATPLDRGGFPMRAGAGEMLFTPSSLRAGESETMAMVQFETTELICDASVRDEALRLMAGCGRNKACGFIGPFDAVLRGGATPQMEEKIAELIEQAADNQVSMGRVCGSGSVTSPGAIQAAMEEAMRAGCRLICVHYLTSDLAYIGAREAAAPFWRAAANCGF